MKRLCKRCFFEEYTSDYIKLVEMSAANVVCEKCGEHKQIVVNYSLGIPPQCRNFLYLGPSETKD